MRTEHNDAPSSVVTNLPFLCAGATLLCPKNDDGTATGHCPYCGCASMTDHRQAFALPDAVRVPCRDGDSFNSPINGCPQCWYGYEEGCAASCECHGLGWTPATDGWEEVTTGVAIFKYGDGGWAGHIQLNHITRGHCGGDFGYQPTYRAALFAAIHAALESMGATFPPKVNNG